MPARYYPRAPSGYTRPLIPSSRFKALEKRVEAKKEVSDCIKSVDQTLQDADASQDSRYIFSEDTALEFTRAVAEGVALVDEWKRSIGKPVSASCVVLVSIPRHDRSAPCSDTPSKTRGYGEEAARLGAQNEAGPGQAPDEGTS